MTKLEEQNNSRSIMAANNTKSIIIIGAGIAGLSAGCYARMNGYRTRIFEMHTLPGGLCTSWRRKGYTFDGCVQWLTGSALGGGLDGFYQIWQELGAVQGRKMVNHAEFFHICDPSGKRLVLYTNADRLEQHLKDLAPEDSKMIEGFANAIRRLVHYGLPIQKPPELRNSWDKARLLLGTLPYMDIFQEYGSISIRDFAQRFRSPLLRKLFPLMFFEMDDFPVFAILYTLAGLHAHQYGYPVGGSLALARSIEQRYQALGGEISYQAKVDRVIIQDHQAIGVRLEDGREFYADDIVSAADGHWTIFDLLGGRYINDAIRQNYETLPVYQPLVLVSLGINQDLSQEPHAVYYPLTEPLKVGEKTEQWIGIRHYGFDPTLAPVGKSIVSVEFFSDYAYWKGLARDRAVYEAEKQRIAERIIDELERHYPGIRSQVEVVDVATPLTFTRYTGVWKGCWMGWKMTTGLPRKGKPKTLPGLDHFYMAGQWVEATGGLPNAAKSGRDLVQILCRRDDQPFTADCPI
jgi:phytoene dehydrogenase-like protein